MRAVDHAWQLHRRWSVLANTGHHRIDARRRWNLRLLIGGATAGTVAGLADDRSVLVGVASGVAAGCLTGAAMLQQRALSPNQISAWLEARIVSESLCSAVYRHLTLGLADDAVAGAALDDQIERLQAEAAEYQVALQGVSVDDRPIPAIANLPEYVEVRARAQSTWHRGKIDELSRRARQYRWLELSATVIGGVLSVVAAALATSALAPVVGAFTTVAAACASHLSASKYDRIAAGYATTVARLDRIIDRLPPAPDAHDAAAFVESIEQVLSDQNTAWQSLLSAD